VRESRRVTDFTKQARRNAIGRRLCHTNVQTGKTVFGRRKHIKIRHHSRSKTVYVGASHTSEAGNHRQNTLDRASRRVGHASSSSRQPRLINVLSMSVLAAWKIHTNATGPTEVLDHIQFRREVVVGLLKSTSCQLLGGPTAPVPG
jgi:hypothetical protein